MDKINFGPVSIVAVDSDSGVNLHLEVDGSMTSSVKATDEQWQAALRLAGVIGMHD
jgi:hypothetical protein